MVELGLSQDQPLVVVFAMVRCYAASSLFTAAVLVSKRMGSGWDGAKLSGCAGALWAMGWLAGVVG